MIKNNDIKIGVISLGCDKNRVDTEKMLYILKESGYTLMQDESEADVIIVNTCAFIEKAREEAIDTILSVEKNKENKKIIVTGCLPQRFIGELFDNLTEVDAFLGVSDYDKLPSVIERVIGGERVNAVGQAKGECGKRRVLTTDGYAYLKIADGCSNHCTYCLIPFIRGKYRSVSFSDLIDEAKSLGRVNELILVAQDVTRYGEDFTPKKTLCDLIRALSALDNVEGIRLLYCYPENVTDELIHEIAVNAKMIRYLDIPMQHADDRVLRRMNRKGTFDGYISLIGKLKREIPNLVIRSTFMTGFCGETEEEFNTLVNFIEKAQLFNVGFFAYSSEEGTPAFNLPDDVPTSVKKRRLKKLYAVQKKVASKLMKQMVGKFFTVFAEGFDEQMIMYYGRAYFNAPDVDGKIYFFSKDEVEYGKNYNVKIVKSDGYDLYGERI